MKWVVVIGALIVQPQMDNPLMKTTRRKALVSLAAFPASIAIAAAPDAKTDAAEKLIGSWHTTSAVTSIILSIERGGEALFMFIENGAYSIDRVRWKPLPGGLMIEGAFRIRLWLGTSPDNLRAEMEELPPHAEVSNGFARFPISFFMRRVGSRNVPPESLQRDLPKHWRGETPGEGWDQKAGKRREPPKRD